uniref:60S ribosomal protein L10P insertion domain-containing protein n=2 Tax=Araucaria cunninghamii TaxID=56994 RepID=A0A0D6R4I9_ARACU
MAAAMRIFSQRLGTSTLYLSRRALSQGSGKGFFQPEKVTENVLIKDIDVCSDSSSNSSRESAAVALDKHSVTISVHDATFPSKAEKMVYDKKICALLQEYPQVLVCMADNLESNQLQSIRRHLRPDSVVLMGKNNLMKRSIEIYAEKSKNSSYQKMTPLLVGNVGLIFTKGDLREVREKGLLGKLGIQPFSYGLIVKAIYGDGSVFDHAVLDLIEDDSLDKFSTSLSLWQPYLWLSTILH